MYKRYDFDVFYNSVCVYSCSFSSINNLVKFACGFDRNVCDLSAVDNVFERDIPLEDLCIEFEGDCYGI